MMWLNGFEKLFKGFLKSSIQYINKFVFLRNNRFIFYSVERLFEILLGHQR